MTSAPATGTNMTKTPKEWPAGETSDVCQRPKKKRLVNNPISRSSPSATNALKIPIPVASSEMARTRGVVVKSPSRSCPAPSSARAARFVISLTSGSRSFTPTSSNSSCPAATGAAHAGGFSCGSDHSTERPNQFGTGCAELCETLPGEVVQNLFSSRGEANEHLPSVFLSLDAPDQSALLQSVDQSHHAMMAELQTLR